MPSIIGCILHTHFKNFYLPMRYGRGCNDALFTNTVPTSAKGIPEARYNSSICRIFFNLIVNYANPNRIFTKSGFGVKICNSTILGFNRHHSTRAIT
jgi:hypothetical protein